MRGWRARIGLLYPASGLVDDEFYRLVPPGVSVHITRVGVHGNISAEKVKAFSEVDNLIKFAKDLEPLRPNCIAWACTSGSFLAGKEASGRQVAALALATGTKCTNTSESMVEALQHLGIKRVGVGTPYPDEFNAPIVNFLEEHGFDVPAVDNLRLKNDWEIGTAAPRNYLCARAPGSRRWRRSRLPLMHRPVCRGSHRNNGKGSWAPDLDRESGDDVECLAALRRLDKRVGALRFVVRGEREERAGRCRFPPLNPSLIRRTRTAAA